MMRPIGKKVYILLKYYVWLSSCTTLAIDNAHFYRAAYFWGEPRLEKPGLFSFDCSLGYGSTHTSRNSANKKVPLLDLFGPFNMQALGTNVPHLDPNNNLDKILIDLADRPARGTFGHLQFSGKFNIVESTISVFQNIKNGFFLQAYLPVRRLHISDVRCKDLSPRDTIEPNRNTQAWQDFLSSFNEILARYNLSLKPAHQTGVGDFSLLLGWSINYQDTTHVDYIDVTSKIGILFPTGRTKNENRPFDLPLGYNGHYGLPVFVQGSFGAFEWLTIGAHTGAVFLFDKTKTLRLKTSDEQNGLIALAQDNVEVDAGTVWTVGTYAKADHFAAGLSLLAGYSFNNKDADTLTLKNNALTIREFINTDITRQGWNMHIFHATIEYDFATDCCKPGWRLSFFYNRILGGKRVFNTQIKSFNMGLDVGLTW